MSVTETAFKLPTPVEGLEAIHELVGQTHWLQGHYQDRCEWLDKNGEPVVINGLPCYKVGWCLAGLINKQACLDHAEVLDTNALINMPGDGGGYLGDEGLREIAEDWNNELGHSFDRLKLARTMGEFVWASVQEDESFTNLTDPAHCIETWNDQITTGRDDVLRVLDRAIVAAKAAAAA